MAERLTRAGMRPINNVVDVSNYVMLELGQPNHTYDLAKLEGGGFRIRKARDGEKIVTLDGVERELTVGRRADLRRQRRGDRHRWRDGWRRRPRSTSTRRRSRSRWRGSTRPRIAATAGRLGLALRGVGALRAGRRPRDRGPRRVAGSSSCSVSPALTRSSTARSTRAVCCRRELRCLSDGRG